MALLRSLGVLTTLLLGANLILMMPGADADSYNNAGVVPISDPSNAQGPRATALQTPKAAQAAQDAATAKKQQLKALILQQQQQQQQQQQSQQAASQPLLARSSSAPASSTRQAVAPSATAGSSPRNGPAVTASTPPAAARAAGSTRRKTVPNTGTAAAAGAKAATGKQKQLLRQAAGLRAVEADGTGGQWELLGTAPVAAAHLAQVPGSDTYLLMDFTDGQHPPSNPDGKDILQLWDRPSNTYTPINLESHSVCGGWTRLPNGDTGMYAGFFDSSFQKGALDAINFYDSTTRTTTKRSSLTAKRWYSASITLPDGQAYIFGGTEGAEGTTRAPGSDVYDFATNTTTQLPVNEALVNATVGGYYADIFVLPTGDLAIMSGQVIQVINYTTGQTLASTPSFEGTRAAGIYWEYPYMATTVVLATRVLAPSSATRIEFMAFGGNFPRQNPTDTTPCAALSVRIGLNIGADGAYAFDEAYEIEDMPTPRCIANTVLLPNGNVVIINGAKEGFGGLATDNLANEPVNEPWIYQPDAPAGKRYTTTGATTNIARLYHSSALLTSQGDILITGTTRGTAFQAIDKESFDITPYNNSEFRVQIFTPSYIDTTASQAARPSIYFAPTNVEYGSVFSIATFGLPSNGANAALMLYDPGTNTHSLSMGRRAQALAFSVRGKVKDVKGMLSIKVEAPATAAAAPPGFYLLFVVSGDGSGSYSAGTWVQLRPAGFSTPPLTIPKDSVLLNSVSTKFERSTLYTGRTVANTASFDLASKVPSAMGSGLAGALVRIGGNSTQEEDVRLVGPAVGLSASNTYYTELWARADSEAQASFAWVDADGAAADGSYTALNLGPHWQLFNAPPFKPAADGKLAPVINLGSVPAGNSCSFDDIRVFSSDSDTRAVPTVRIANEPVASSSSMEPLPGVVVPQLSAPEKPEFLRGMVFTA